MLSIVVIGKNEIKNINRVASSIERLKAVFGEDIQSIYVDSASSDGSYESAMSRFDACYQLKSSEYLCASAGRAVGTMKAANEWILYLDADMEICEEFAGLLPQLVASNEIGGYIGDYVHCYDDGSVYRDNKGNVTGLHAKHIGGAVLLQRYFVLEAGNWNPSLFAMEEMELYFRLINIGKIINYIDVPMVRHYTIRLAKKEMFKRLFCPSGGLGKKYYGYGQLIAAKIKSGTLLQLIKYYRYMFIYWLGILLSVAIVPINYIVGLCMIGAVIVMILVKGRVVWLVVYTAYFFQMVVGFNKYNAKYLPEIQRDNVR